MYTFGSGLKSSGLHKTPGLTRFRRRAAGRHDTSPLAGDKGPSAKEKERVTEERIASALRQANAGTPRTRMEGSRSGAVGGWVYFFRAVRFLGIWIL